MLAFVLIGRASHGEQEAVTGLLRTLWPFAAGLAVGWLVLSRPDRVVATPATRVRAGLVVGLHTAVVGIALRAIAGQGVAWSFLVVAVVVLTAFTTGWRAVLAGWRRRR